MPRIDIDIPDDPVFQKNLKELLKANHRTQKNFIEALVIAAVNKNVHDLYYMVGIIVKKEK